MHRVVFFTSKNIHVLKWHQEEVDQKETKCVWLQRRLERIVLTLAGSVTLDPKSRFLVQNKPTHGSSPASPARSPGVNNKASCHLKFELRFDKIFCAMHFLS